MRIISTTSIEYLSVTLTTLAGFVSSLSSEIIDDIDVYAGGYGAEYGVDSQAVIDISSKNNGSPTDLGGKFNLNALYSEGIASGKNRRKTGSGTPPDVEVISTSSSDLSPLMTGSILGFSSLSGIINLKQAMTLMKNTNSFLIFSPLGTSFAHKIGR